MIDRSHTNRIGIAAPNSKGIKRSMGSSARKLWTINTIPEEIAIKTSRTRDRMLAPAAQTTVRLNLAAASIRNVILYRTPSAMTTMMDSTYKLKSSAVPTIAEARLANCRPQRYSPAFGQTPKRSILLRRRKATKNSISPIVEN